MTLSEIRKKKTELLARRQLVMTEAAEMFRARRGKLAPDAPPETAYRREVRRHVQQHLNGSTPPKLLPSSFEIEKEQALLAEREACDIVLSELARQEEIAIDAEVKNWIETHGDEWRELAREIVLTTIRLAALENKVRHTLETALRGRIAAGLALGSQIGGGQSVLGINDPLRELRAAALTEGVIHLWEITEIEKTVGAAHTDRDQREWQNG